MGIAIVTCEILKSVWCEARPNTTVPQKCYSAKSAKLQILDQIDYIVNNDLHQKCLACESGGTCKFTGTFAAIPNVVAERTWSNPSVCFQVHPASVGQFIDLAKLGGNVNNLCDGVVKIL